MANVINATSTGNGGLVSTGDDSGILNIQTNETTAITVDTSQNVGIGTSSPADKLHVAFSSGSLGGIRVQNTNSGGQSAVSYYNDAATQKADIWWNNSGSTLNLRTLSTDPMIFYTNNSERMRITSAGDILVGRTTQFLDGQYSSDFNGNSRRGATYNNTFGNSGANFISFGSAGTQIGGVSQSGGSAVLYNTTSDQRLKENIVDADSASTLIDSLQVRKFDWKSDNSHQRYGFVAQELVTVAPEAVHQPEDTEQMMAVDYSKLVPMLVKEIQSLRSRFATLEIKSDTQAETINALTARIVALEGQ